MDMIAFFAVAFGELNTIFQECEDLEHHPKNLIIIPTCLITIALSWLTSEIEAKVALKTDMS